MIDGQTELYGVIGNPVQHSLSPIIHNGAFKRLGWNAVYLAFEVKNIEEAVRGIRGLGVRGVSVTIPFKTEVIPFLDKVEGLAKKIGAVNTIVESKGKADRLQHGLRWRRRSIGREDGLERKEGRSSRGRWRGPGHRFWFTGKRISIDRR